MPRRQTTTRQDMIEGAFQLVRRQGHEALTARSLAAALGCSTQPVMYQFPNLAALRAEAYQRADAYHTAYIMAGDDLLSVGLRYVRFAAEEPMLFRFLFQSGHFDGARLGELVRAPEAAGLLDAVSAESGARGEDAAKLFEALFVAAHGYAGLIANNAMAYDAGAIRETLAGIAEGWMKRGNPCDEAVSQE